MSDKKYTVGQKLWWVPPFNTYDKGGRNGGYEVTVTKVGIKYVTVEAMLGDTHKWRLEHVFVKITGLENTAYRQGKAWPTREAYEENKALLGSWRALCKLAREKLVEHRPAPSDLTMSEIETITGILESLA